MDFFLPQGNAAALCPGASYSVPGLFLYADLVYQCMDWVNDKFNYQIPVRYIYGSPKVIWNCGRIIITDRGDTLESVEKELSGAVARGIVPLLTFSAPNLTLKDLEDPFCNQILSISNRYHGGVIVSSPLLAEYIHRNYPQVEVHASVIVTSFEEQRSHTYYETLSKSFSRYVVHPDDNFNTALLRQLPKAEAEILVNERCVYQCRQRRSHYESIVQDQAAFISGNHDITNFLDQCPFVPDKKQKATKERNISLEAQDVCRLQKMGFSLFKLQGRLDIPYVFFFDFLRYTLENQVAFPAMFSVFAYAIKDYLKEKEKKRQDRG